MHNWQNGWVSKVLIHLSWKRQISADSVGSGSNLNCSCLIVCSLFFLKIISRYISTYLIRETPKKFQDSTTSYERSFLPFWPHFKTGIKNSKKSKNWKTFALCHYMWPRCEGFPIFWIFLNFLCPFQNASKRRAWPFLASGWILEIFWCFYD